MTRVEEVDQDLGQADLLIIADRLAAVRELLRLIANEVAPHSMWGSEAAIERWRAEVYDRMQALGLALHEFAASNPGEERLAAAQTLVADKLRALSLTSPIINFTRQDKRRRLSYYELVQHIRSGKPAGADMPARVLDDYFVHARIGQAFLNRLNLLNRRLVDEVARCVASGEHPLHLISLQYIGGDDLLPLARATSVANGFLVTALDDNRNAVREAEQRLRPAFNSRIRCLRADPVKWLQGPDARAGSACIVYAPSIDPFSDARAEGLLAGALRVLQRGGVLLAGATPGKAPLAELTLRDWLLGWDYRYRSEAEWRDLFARSAFPPDTLTFEYELLGIGAVIRVEKGA